MKPLQCPKCSGVDLKVFNSRREHTNHGRAVGEFGAVWRRRRCQDCSYRFTTYEISEADLKAFMTYRKAQALLMEITV